MEFRLVGVVRMLAQKSFDNNDNYFNTNSNHTFFETPFLPITTPLIFFTQIAEDDEVFLKFSFELSLKGKKLILKSNKLKN
jgi:hypothetical protein